VTRRRDLAVRLALGASSWQLARGVLAESVLIATTGSALGIALALACVQLFVQTATGIVPRLDAIAVDLPVLAVDAGALPEIAGEQGAVFVDPDNMDEVVRMLERVLIEDDLRAYLIANGRANLARYQWTRAAEQIRQIYEFLFYPRDQVAVPGRKFSLTKFF
jgi:glycosyltransferase involved in cell wall biosynthesis